MKNVKLGLFALLGIVGVASAFTNAPTKTFGATYYAVTDGAKSFIWTTSQPSPLVCGNPSSGTTLPNGCTVQTTGGTGFAPTNGQVIPATNVHSVTNSGKLYK